MRLFVYCCIAKADVPSISESVGLDFVETSAKSGLNVDTAFRRAVVSVARRLPHIKKSIQQAGLPEGWLRCPPVGGNGAPLFQVRLTDYEEVMLSVL